MSQQPPRIVGVYPHPDRQSAFDVAADLTARLQAAGVAVRLPKPVAERLRHAGLGVDEHTLNDTCDLVVSVGGDGTFLRAFATAPDVPLIGVNCGELGFLAEVRLDEMDALVTRIAAGDTPTDDRLLVELLRDGHRLGIALNDVHFGKPLAGRVVKLAVEIDGRPFTTYAADGLVFATPTGSTAYNFSADGPLVDPAVTAFVVTPVAPHMLWSRSIVLPESARVDVRVVGDRPCQLACDGQIVAELVTGDVIQVGVAPERARLVRWRTDGFPTRVREKFGLDRPREV